VLRDHPELNETSRLTILESLHSVRLVLWDEEKKQLISFKDLRRASPAALQGGAMA
jgi:omega-6 fatty acid desaturase (delta-12 desaturase)